ncbi:MAG: thioesterase family protein [Flavobacteriaceae bacterium]
MIENTINIRVRYSETDQMKYVYYGNYAAYFEMGRVEWLRKFGVSYKEMEDDGIMLPVINMNIKYHKPALYDDLLTLKTTLLKLPQVKIDFNFTIYNQKDELLTTATTTLVFWDMERNKPTRAPQNLMDKIKPYF